jgi:uracil-DNA glycosylase
MQASLSSPILPSNILDAIKLAHPGWRPILQAGLNAMIQADQEYLALLVQDDFLPDGGRIFAAFSQPIDAVRYVLVGEGPYPRAESATGFCFMDGAVGELWSETGLSKKVNRATSLRNFMKMLLVADGQLSVSQTTGDAVTRVGLHAQSSKSSMIQTLADLQKNLHRNGFLLLNATPVYRAHVPPAKESKAWLPFVQTLLQALSNHADTNGKTPPKLVLWGKIAEKLSAMQVSKGFPKAVSEHPYNLSFIANPGMQAIFAPMRLLQRAW